MWYDFAAFLQNAAKNSTSYTGSVCIFCEVYLSRYVASIFFI